jgi:CTP:molybdopterin cytidylyltransferase MocA
MARIVGVLLAAGQGARFGGDKLLAPIDAVGGHRCRRQSASRLAT